MPCETFFWMALHFPIDNYIFAPYAQSFIKCLESKTLIFITAPKRGKKHILFLSQWNRFWARQQAWQYMSGMRWDKTRGARALGQPALPCWDTNTALACSPALFKHTQTTAANLSQHVQHCMCVHLLLVWLRF